MTAPGAWAANSTAPPPKRLCPVRISASPSLDLRQSEAQRLTGTWLPGDPGDVESQGPRGSHVRADRTADASGAAEHIHVLLPGAELSHVAVAGAGLGAVPRAAHPDRSGAGLRCGRAAAYLGLPPLLQPRHLEPGRPRVRGVRAGGAPAARRPAAGGAG